MERNTKDPQVVCAVNILLENKRKAKQMLGEMEENAYSAKTEHSLRMSGALFR